MLDDRKGEEMNKEIELIKNILKTREELKNNNRARSAKLRIIERVK